MNDYLKNNTEITNYMEPLLQHYGLKTKWLDLTYDFNTACQFGSKIHSKKDREKISLEAPDETNYCYIFVFLLDKNDFRYITHFVSNPRGLFFESMGEYKMCMKWFGI